jgi:predicted nucleic acid-binding Zn ribbon protein
VTDGSDFDRLGDLLPVGKEGARETESKPRSGGAGSVRPVGRPPTDARHLSAGRQAAAAAGPATDRRPPGGAAGEASDLARRLAEVWEEAVGAEIATNAHPVHVRDGRLVVTTSSSAWAQTLQAMSEMVASKINEKLGGEVVTRAVFRHAGWEDFPATAARTAARAATARKVRGKAVATPAANQPVPNPPAPLGASSGASAGPSGSGAADDLTGLSDDERRALADLEALPLSAAVKDTVREAMLAGFVRARQDLNR